MSAKEPPFCIGNVIRDPTGSMLVVTEVDDDLVEAVSFDHENVSAAQRLDDHERTASCACEGDPECERCRGDGSYRQKVKGWRRSKVLAPTVREFLLKGLRKQFGID